MADIVWCETVEGERIPLDEHELQMPAREGDQEEAIERYRIIETTVPPTIEPVAKNFPEAAMVDHRKICQQPRVM
jgi:hypothetical protein